MKEEHTDKQGKQLVNACQGLEADMVSQLCNGISKLYLEKMRKKKKTERKVCAFAEYWYSPKIKNKN